MHRQSPQRQTKPKHSKPRQLQPLPSQRLTPGCTKRPSPRRRSRRRAFSPLSLSPYVPLQESSVISFQHSAASCRPAHDAGVLRAPRSPAPNEAEPAAQYYSVPSSPRPSVPLPIPCLRAFPAPNEPTAPPAPSMSLRRAKESGTLSPTTTRRGHQSLERQRRAPHARPQRPLTVPSDGFLTLARGCDALYQKTSPAGATPGNMGNHRLGGSLALPKHAHASVGMAPGL